MKYFLGLICDGCKVMIHIDFYERTFQNAQTIQTVNVSYFEIFQRCVYSVHVAGGGFPYKNDGGARHTF